MASVRARFLKQKPGRVISQPHEVQVNGKPAIKTTFAQMRKREGMAPARIISDDY